MEAYQILHADVLDIIFEGREKAYGAYELRKNYSKRLSVSLLSLVIFIVFIFFIPRYSGSVQSRQFDIPHVLDPMPEPDAEKPEVPPPPQPPKELPQVKQRIYMTPLIVDEADPDERPPEMDSLANARIGSVRTEGEDDDVVRPPQPSTTGVIETPQRREQQDEGFIPIEIESEYPGGREAWLRFLIKNLRYPQSAQEIGIEGTVIVEFVVDAKGNVSQVAAVSGPNELRDEAVRVILKSGNWTPAIQNHRHVKSQKKQPILFRLAAE
jgi:periplasmic protein TonB